MDSGGGMSSMSRSAHAPMSGGPVASTTSMPTPSSSMPTMKPTSSSSYQTSAKFHSSHTTTAAGETQFSSSSHIKTPAESDAQTTDSPVQQFTRHRIHRPKMYTPKDQDTLSKANSSPLPPIRESNTASNSQYNRGVQFDLEAAAFPPLPGLDADTAKPHNASTETASTDSLQSHWENRLSDVVKGTAKLKSTKDKEPAAGVAQQYHQQQQQPTNNSSRSASPGSSAGGPLGASETVANPGASSAMPAVSAPSNTNSSASNTDSADIALSTITLTPPSSPDK